MSFSHCSSTFCCNVEDTQTRRKDIVEHSWPAAVDVLLLIAVAGASDPTDSKQDLHLTMSGKGDS